MVLSSFASASIKCLIEALLWGSLREGGTIHETQSVCHRPALMIAVKPLFHDKYSGDTGRNTMWMRKVGDGTETTVEQALMRGLVTA